MSFKNATKMSTFNIDFLPVSLLVKSKIINTRDQCDNYNVFCIQIHLILFSSLNTFGDFVRKRAITRDRKLIS